PRDLEEIRRLQADLERTQDPAASRRLGERMLALGARYPNDPDFDSALVYVQRRAVQRPQAANGPHDETEEQGATQMFSPPTPGRADRRPVSPSIITASLPGATPQPPRTADMPTRIA